MNRLILTGILLVNLLRFIGIENAPPDFYTDEAVGAAHVLCLKETGSDLRQHPLPLFSRGLDIGYYTAPYLYGELAWTSVFGNSRASFRSFLAFVSVSTLLLLFWWVRKRTDSETALVALLLGSISPWVFQFSRIAWDPPLAPFFLMLGLVALDWKHRLSPVAGGFAFALASYAYPASRLQAAFLLLLIPGQSWKSKSVTLATFVVALIPMAYQTWTDPMFSVRSQILILWSDHPMNPFRFLGPMEWIRVFFENILKHLHPDFLLISGDRNLRHSTGFSGLMSPAEWLLLMGGAIVGMGIMTFHFIRNRTRSIQIFFKIDPMVWFCMIAAFLGLMPAALTWEGLPHALRSIGAWPFLVILAALAFRPIQNRFRTTAMITLLLIASVYSVRYFSNFFKDYPTTASAWFQTGADPVSNAYNRMTSESVSCKDIQKAILDGHY